MNSTHKKLFWSGLALFIIPELLWSPVANVYYTFFQSGNEIVRLRNNFITSSDYDLLYRLVILSEVFGLLVSAWVSREVLLNNSNKALGILVLILLVLAIALGLLSFYAITFINVSFP